MLEYLRGLDDGSGRPTRRSSTSSTAGDSTTANGGSNGASSRHGGCPARRRPPRADLALLAGRGGPEFAPEGVLPIVVFYGAWQLWGLAPGIVVATALSASVVICQMRRGNDAPLARIALVFLAMQAVIGIASHNATVYLAQPIVLSAGWGVAYLVSAAIGRPLVGVFARAWYPFPPEFRAERAFRREFGMQSVVWGLFCLARAGLRLAALLGAGVGGFRARLVRDRGAGLLALVAWGLWHARRRFSRSDDGAEAALAEADEPCYGAATTERVPDAQFASPLPVPEQWRRCYIYGNRNRQVVQR